MMKLTILGSCSAYPTIDRFTTSQILQINGKSFLIDCGEGTQIQLRNNKKSIHHLNNESVLEASKKSLFDNNEEYEKLSF